MKKILLTFLAFIYFGLAVRATVHLHDCIDVFSEVQDSHTGPVEKSSCNNDPKQCNFETEQRINEAALKSYRVLDAGLLPEFAGYHVLKQYVFHHPDSDQYTRVRIQKIPLFILHRVIRC